MKGCDVFRRKIIEGKFKLNEGEFNTDLLIIPDHSMKISLLIHLLLAALIVLVSRGSQRSIPLEKWKIDANQFGFHDPNLEDWFSFIVESSHKSLSQLVTVMRNGAEGEKRFLAALFITTSAVVNPEDRFYADVLLVTAAHSHIWRREIENEIEELVSKGWSKAASEQSFALRTPKIHAPAILTACHDSTRGLKKAATILLTAHNAVGLSVPDQILAQLRNLAQE
jgi:hypothetical protein